MRCLYSCDKYDAETASLQMLKSVPNQEPDVKGIMSVVCELRDRPQPHQTPPVRSRLSLSYLCVGAEWACDAVRMLMGVACHVLRVRYVSVCVSHGA